MKLVIAEKPSAAAVMAAAIGADERKDGYLEGNGYLVSWCIGHLVEPAQPEAYNAAWKKWDYGTLPILPVEWKYEVRESGKRQFAILKKLMSDKRVETLVNACDAGREGELIFRLACQQAGCRKPATRLWASSMEEAEIKKAFEKMRPESDYDRLYEGALCRQRSDWLVGINATRLFTVLDGGKIRKVGRVQTPTLALVAGREAEISKFKKEPFYTLHALLGGAEAVSGKFPTGEAAKEAAEAAQREGIHILEAESEDKAESPPLPYDLTALQRDANRIFGFTAKQTLDYTQALYEKKLCTYPRTDSRHLSDGMGQAAGEAIASSLLAFLPGWEKPVGWEWDTGRILDSRKVTDHHAIIPTAGLSEEKTEGIPEGERKILHLISFGLLASAAPKRRYRAWKATAQGGGVDFHANGTVELDTGWKLFGRKLREAYGLPQQEQETGSSPDGLAEGAFYPEPDIETREGWTRPPLRYTEDTLLAAMERAGAKDEAENVERKGIGTPATRADTIEKLVKDGLMEREGKSLCPTRAGLELLSAVPDTLKSPQLTAAWENALAEIADGRRDPGEFMDGIHKMLSGLVAAYREAADSAQGPGNRMALGKCPQCGEDVVDGKYGAYCTGRCGMVLNRALGKRLSAEQTKALLDGGKIFLEGLEGKNGRTYSASVKPAGIQPFQYEKGGKAQSGFQFRFDFEFPRQGNRQTTLNGQRQQ